MKNRRVVLFVCSLLCVSVIGLTGCNGGKEVSEKEYYDKLANVEAKFQKHMGIVLNDYSDFIDEMKNWKDLLGW